MGSKFLFNILVAFGVTIPYVAALADEVTIVITTDIRNISIFSVQVGMKSKQTITLDTDKLDTTNEFETGVTNILGADLASVRDEFTVTKPTKNGNTITLSAKGQTASKVSVMGDIDYSFTFKLNTKKNRVWLSGCHNQFPSYKVEIKGTVVYDREQTGTAITDLIGVCDIVVGKDDVSF